MSALYLGNGQEVDTLSARALQPLNHQIAQVAYLSACSTAEIGARNLADESIHLASTFQLIGFRHFVGTLWPSDDESAVKIATAFYMRLTESTEEEHVVSNAMHYALLFWRSELDKRGMSEEQQLRLWAPFIHLGL
jgi:CHAT domain-containing protein